MAICKYCKIEFDITSEPRGWMANHTRWCSRNPKREQFIKNLECLRTEEVKQKISESIKLLHALGKYDYVDNGKGMQMSGHSTEAKAKISAKALKSGHRRLVKSTREYICKDGTKILLDSSWEEALAKRLDEKQIKWSRPSFLIWVDTTGKERKYFPDFYLPDFNIYVDPKNPAALKQ